MTNTSCIPDFALNLVSKQVVTIPLRPPPPGISIQDSATLQAKLADPGQALDVQCAVQTASA
jgi:hypothetical protein